MKKALVALSLLTLPIYAPNEKITPELVQSYVAHEIERQQEERLERMVWKSAMTASAITGGIGLVVGIAIAVWMNRS